MNQDKIIILKESFDNHLKALWWNLSTALLVIVVFWLVSKFGGFEDIFSLSKPQPLIYVAIFYLVISLPALYLHIEYSVVNHNWLIEIKESDIVVYKGKTEWKKIRKSDIKLLVFYRSMNARKSGGMKLGAQESYFFAKLVTHTNENICVTCLVAPKLDILQEQIPDAVFVDKATAFSSVFLQQRFSSV